MQNSLKLDNEYKAGELMVALWDSAVWSDTQQAFVERNGSPFPFLAEEAIRSTFFGDRHLSIAFAVRAAFKVLRG